METLQRLFVFKKELFDELYEKQNNQPMSDQQRQFAAELIRDIWEETP